MKVGLLIFSFYFFNGVLFASSLIQAAVMANDAYLPQKQFLDKYTSPDYKLIAARAESIKYYIFSQKDKLFIVFEGTNSLSSLQADLDIKEVQFLDKPESRVHNGYFIEAVQARNSLRLYLSKEKKIMITGHSLGGAVAHLLSAILYKEGYRVKLYTFGSPPVGNHTFVESIQGLSHERYTHILDLIPMLKREYIVKMKEALAYVNKHLPENESFYNLIESVDDIPYEYMHQGEHHYIYNLGSLSAEYEESPWYTQMFMRAQLYHSSKNYLDGVQ
jgi:predicted lipase